MTQFLEVVRQHILGVVGNVTIVANLKDFPAVKEFWKSVKIWRNYYHNRVTHFFETRCTRVVPTNHSSCQNTTWMDLLYGVRILAVEYFVLSQCTRLTDRRTQPTDRQTDRHTFRQQYLHIHSQSHCKQCWNVKNVFQSLPWTDVISKLFLH